MWVLDKEKLTIWRGEIVVADLAYWGVRLTQRHWVMAGTQRKKYSWGIGK